MLPLVSMESLAGSRVIGVKVCRLKLSSSSMVKMAVLLEVSTLLKTAVPFTFEASACVYSPALGAFASMLLALLGCDLVQIKPKPLSEYSAKSLSPSLSVSSSLESPKPEMLKLGSILSLESIEAIA